MATATYNGVGGSGGSLFEGLKFWFALRVPMRQHWIDLVIANGGEQVKLEKMADIQIVDHMVKNCAVGAISWRFIEQSVKRGELEDLEHHRVRQVEESIRPVGSNKPAKTTRTHFTAEDDQILMRWVLKAERDGLATMGNDIYQQLERKNSRHTYQSWRHRWVKYVSRLDRPTIEADEEEEDIAPESSGPALPENAANGRPSKTQKEVSQISPVKREGATTKSIIRTDSTKSPPVPGPWVAKSKGGRLFTPQENKLLFNEYDDIVNINPDEEINAWAAWSIRYPNHTPQEWRNYFVKELTPLVEERIRTKEQVKSSTARRQDSGISFSELKRTSATSTRPMVFVKEEPTNANLTVASKSASSKTRTSPASVSTESEMYVTSQASKEVVHSKTLLNHREPASQQPSHMVDDPLLDDEVQFNNYVRILAERLEIIIDFNPVICGKEISLFRLWQVVRGEFGGIDEVNGKDLWFKVARALRLEGPTYRQELKSSYNVILPDVEGSRSFYWNETSSQEQAMIESQLRKTIEPDVQELSDLEYATAAEYDQNLEVEEEDDGLDRSPSSARLLRPDRLGKRGSPSVDEESGQPLKRPRLDKGKGKEIPSTPEGNADGELTEFSFGLRTPPFGIGSPILGESAEKAFTNYTMNETPSKSSKNNEIKTCITEPETQNFTYLDKGNEEKEEGPEFEQTVTSDRPSQSMCDALPVRLSQQLYDTQSVAAEVDSRVRGFFHQCRAQKYSLENVSASLRATCWDASIAEDVIMSLEAGLGLPNNSKGVWTPEDDESLSPRTGPAWRKIKKKHGSDGVLARIKFLEENL
ncbi:TRF2-interacting telomeric protein/Rap1 C terminal domain-containing protein [Calycina marina]|uniref:DNA-binding protein RAP1 n=1 Tax=Calycina marina TaxID=1763456 RepID=A0A9P8CCC7_9HELO|nr:TRF2-interacting telomeric protein/Rap1 C terminal domain-containing protein [Calycina marina]